MAGNDFLQTYLKILTTEQLLELISMAAVQCEDTIDKELTHLCSDCIHKISVADLDAFEQDAYQHGRADAISELQATWVEGYEAGKADMFEKLKPSADSQSYEQGRIDTIDIIFDRLHDFIDYSTENYGCSCFESRSDALTDFESWLYELYKG